jgi:predicted hotdog family 3-hydroxylacyl-ACP dehydratase
VTLTGTGGAGGPYTFSATGLPAGLTMSTGGVISGTPTVTGTFPYTVTVTDSAGNKGTFNCSVTVAAAPSASCAVINAVQNNAITPVTLTGTGGAGGPYTFSATGLPAGLTMSTGGVISGTPTVTGTFPYTVTVTDSAGNKGTFNCSVTVAAAPSASCAVINATQGVAITPVTLTASGGTGTGYTFSATGLPTGLTMSTGGTISGTPTVHGTFPYTVTVTDSAGNKGTLNCSVTVAPVVIQPLSLLCPPGTTGTLGTAYTSTAVPTGGVPPYKFSLASGALPTGLTLNTSTGVISGMPTAAGAFAFSIEVTDSVGNTALSTCSQNCGGAVIWDFSTQTGNLGTSQPYTVNGLTVTAYGFTASNAPAAIYGHNDNAGNLGLGIAGAANNDIDTTHYVQLDLGAVIAAGAANATITASSVQPGESYTIYGSNTLGSIGTPILSNQTGAGVPLSIPTTYRYVSLKAVSGVVTIGSVSFTLGSCQIVIANPINLQCGSCGASNATLGSPYSSQLQLSGGIGPFTFSIASGSLPPGLTLNTSTGVISGTPTTAGTYTFTSMVVDSDGRTDTATCTIVVIVPPINLQCGTCGANKGYVGTPFSAQLAATGGTGGYTYSIVSGSLPPGLTLNASTGAISGTPTTTGTYTFTTKVVDSRGDYDTAICTIIILPSPIDLDCGSCGAGKATVGTGYSSQLSVTGGTAPFTFSIISGSLPPGLTLNTSTGVISGTPTTAGSYTFTSKVVDSKGNSDTQTCTIEVLGAPPVNLDCGVCGSGSGKVGSPYSAALAVSGGTAPYTYSVASGSLPAGLTLNSSTGVISGTPSASGTYTITFKVTDAKGSTDTATCTIVIIGNPIDLDCGTCGAGKATVGTAYSATFHVTGGTGSLTFSVISGTLPPGLALNASTGTLSGNPKTAGSYSFTVKVTDSKGNSDTSTCTVVVTPSPVNLSCGTCGSNYTSVGASYSATLTATGGTGPYTFSLASGSSLPPGLALNSSTGTISGSPTTAGTYTFTTQVVDSKGNSDTATCTLVVSAAPLSLLCGSCGNGKATVGVSYSSALAVQGGTGPFTYSISSGSLPPGITLNTSTGAIGGTPTATGTYTFTSKVTDSKGKTSTATCTIVVVAPITLECGSCGAGKAYQGTSYSSALAVTGGVGPFTFSIVSGSLPPGLTLNPTTGAITGTPTTAGTYTFTSKVVDSNGSSDTVTCTIVVARTPLNLSCGSCGASKAVYRQAYSVTEQATGGTGSYTYSIVSGSLPPGLTLNPSTGVISGSPTVSNGTYTFTIQVVDTAGDSGTTTCTITVISW